MKKILLTMTLVLYLFSINAMASGNEGGFYNPSAATTKVKDLPQKNPLIHYAGLSINRTAILREIARKKSPRELTKYIVDTKTKKPVNPDKMYRLANVEKYFNKSQNPFIKELKKYSYYTDNTVQELFKNSFEHSQGRLYAKCDVRIQ